jgi:hypothetical protein
MATDLIYHCPLKRKDHWNKVNISHTLTAVESGEKSRRHGSKFAQWQAAKRNKLRKSCRIIAEESCKRHTRCCVFTCFGCSSLNAL